MSDKTSLTDLRFYKTPQTVCPYLPDKKEQLLFIHLNDLHPDLTHDLMAKSGFRRSHGIVYKPDCENCSECQPIRVNVEKFKFSKKHNRIYKKNLDINSCEVKLLGSKEHYNLFYKYQNARHSSSNMSLMLFDDYKSMIEDSPVETILIEYRKKNGLLCAVALTDKLIDGYSMVYSFFEPEEQKRSLGNYIILDHIKKAKKYSLSHVYLGYYIKDCNKMSYKKNFKPLEILNKRNWNQYRY